MRHWEIPGLTIAVIHNDAVLFTKAYGYTFTRLEATQVSTARPRGVIKTEGQGFEP